MSAAPGGAVAIVCGGGDFPLAVARSVEATGGKVFLIGLSGIADSAIEAFPHAWVKLGELGRFFRLLEERGIRELALIGHLVRPELGDLGLDLGGVKRLPDIARILAGGGDDDVLRKLAAFFEGEGYRLVAVQDLAPGLIATVGFQTQTRPDEAALADIATGMRLLTALSPFDAGQAAVIAGGRVLAIEAAEGTDAMLDRITAMRASRRIRARGLMGVLVKAPKRGQDRRIDLPALGPQTVERAVAAQLAGLAVAAGGVLLLDRPKMVARADAADLFITGVDMVR